MNWFELVANAFWILALAILVSLFGFASWERTSTGRSLGKILASPGWNLALDLAGLMFCLGLAATSFVLWGRILCLLIAGFCIFHAWGVSRSFMNRT